MQVSLFPLFHETMDVGVEVSSKCQAHNAQLASQHTLPNCSLNYIYPNPYPIHSYFQELQNLVFGSAQPKDLRSVSACPCEVAPSGGRGRMEREKE